MAADVATSIAVSKYWFPFILPRQEPDRADKIKQHRSINIKSPGALWGLDLQVWEQFQIITKLLTAILYGACTVRWNVILDFPNFLMVVGDSESQPSRNRQYIDLAVTKNKVWQKCDKGSVCKEINYDRRSVRFLLMSVHYSWGCSTEVISEIANTATAAAVVQASIRRSFTRSFELV